MPANFNKVILCGNLTRDPELKYTPKGTAVAKIGLAINRQWKDESGQQKEEVTFVDVDAFGRTAENASQYLKKGRSVLVEGRLKLDVWDDKQTGQKRSKLGVVAETIQFLGGGDGQRDGASSAPPNAAREPKTSGVPTRPNRPVAPPPADGTAEKTPEDEEDIPF